MPVAAVPLDEATIRAHERLIDDGVTITDACKALGMSTRTYYQWGQDGQRAKRGTPTREFFDRVFKRRADERGQGKHIPEAVAEQGGFAEFKQFCSTLLLENKQPMEIHPFQQKMLKAYFAGCTETVIIIPKKNGKTTLLAALALYHLDTTEDAECLIAAASRDQASILFNQAAGFVRRSGYEEQFAVRRGFREIRSVRDDGRIRVLASDADTADGVVPTLALVDELHRHKNADLYGVFRDGLGPRDGRIITISTAGDLEDSPLGRMRAASYELPVQDREGPYRYAASKDGSYVLHEWALDESDDLADMKVVARANPAPWQTPEALRRRHQSPSMTSWQWARFACGIWTAGEEAWLPDGAWAACEDVDAEIPDGSDVYVGIDIGRKQDHTALVAAWNREDGRTVVKAKVFTPPTDGTSLDLAIVEEALRGMAQRYNVLQAIYDPWSFERSAQMLSEEGMTLVEHPQTAERMHKSSALIYEAVMSQRIAHDGDPVLAAHVVAGSSKDTERGWRLVKNPKLKRPIDALIAMTLAFSAAAEPPPTGGFEW